MAGPAQASCPSRSRLLRCIAVTTLAAIVALGVVVLIVWLVVRPSQVVYIVEDGSIHGFYLRRNTLNATFDLSIRAHNPNKRLSIYYDSIDVGVWFDEQMIAFAGVSPFFQPHRNVTRLGVKAVAESMPLFGYVSKDLRHQRSSGDIELDVRMRAKIRFKVGVWKSKGYSLRVFCSPVVLHFDSSKGFDKTYCDVDL